MGLSEVQIAELKAKHGQVFELTVGEGTEAKSIVARKPTRLEFKRFRQQARDDAKQDAAGLNLVKTVLLNPDPDTFDGWLEESPGLEDSFGVAILDLIQLKEKAEKKVL